MGDWARHQIHNDYGIIIREQVLGTQVEEICVGDWARYQVGRNEGTTEIENMYPLAGKHVDTRIDV